jgi:hypothetical protein
MSKYVEAALTVIFLALTSWPADARGGHKMGNSVGGHLVGSQGADAFSGARRRGNDAYTQAASDEADRLLNTNLKSICHGC